MRSSRVIDIAATQRPLGSLAEAAGDALHEGRVAHLVGTDLSPRDLPALVRAIGFQPAPAMPKARREGYPRELHYNRWSEGKGYRNPSEQWHVDDSPIEIFTVTAIAPEEYSPGAYTEFIDLHELHRLAADEPWCSRSARTFHSYKGSEPVSYPVVQDDVLSAAPCVTLGAFSVIRLEHEGEVLGGEELERSVARLRNRCTPSQAVWGPGSVLLWSNHRFLHRGSPFTTGVRSLFRVVGRHKGQEHD